MYPAVNISQLKRFVRTYFENKKKTKKKHTVTFGYTIALPSQLGYILISQTLCMAISRATLANRIH